MRSMETPDSLTQDRLPCLGGLGRRDSGQQEDMFVFLVGHGMIVLVLRLRERGLPLPGVTIFRAKSEPSAHQMPVPADLRTGFPR